VQAAFDHLGHINNVVTGRHRAARTAGQPCHGLGELGQIVSVIEKLERGEWILLPAGGESREDLLVFCAENIDREEATVPENSPQRTIDTKSNGNHGRLKPGLLDKTAKHAETAPLTHGADGIKPAGNFPQRGLEPFFSTHNRMHDRRLIRRHRCVDLGGPRRNAAADIRSVGKSASAQKPDNLRATHPAMTKHIDRDITGNLASSRSNLAHGNLEARVKPRNG